MKLRQPQPHFVVKKMVPLKIQFCAYKYVKTMWEKKGEMSINKFNINYNNLVLQFSLGTFTTICFIANHVSKLL